MYKIFFAGLVLLLTCALYFFSVSFFYPELVERGQFGDMFGALNAIFSGSAFLGVIYTIFLQRQDLRLQREELKLTRNELERAAKAQEKSEQALTRQAESLKVTAKLNGLSSLLHQCTVMRDGGIDKYGDGGIIIKWDMRAKKLADQIESIIDQK